MIYSRLLLLTILTHAAFQGFSQSKKLPAEAKPFVIKGFEMMDYATGDLNGDKRPDAILVLKIKGEDTLVESADRPFIILIRQVNGKLKVEKRNDSMVMCRQCGGVFGDPYESTVIEKNGFSLNFYGGSSSRWSYEYSFSYNLAQKNWMLVKERQVSYSTFNPDKSMVEATIGAEELGDISVDNFNSEPPYSGEEWKVIAIKTFFYVNPRIGSKPRKGYLLKDDKVIAIRELKNFVEVSFENSKEQFTTGFILKKDLVKIK